MIADRVVLVVLRAATIAAVVAVSIPLSSSSRAADAVRLRPLVSLYVDAEAVGLREPESVACASDGIAVADAGNGRILLFASAGEVLSATVSIKAAQIPFPISVAFAGDGSVLALDGRSRKIARFSRTGEFLGFLAPSNPDVGDLVARAIAVGPEGDTYVLDVGSRRIVALSLDGTVTRTITFPATALFLSDLVVDDNRDVYAVDSVARRILVARDGEASLAPITEPLTEDMDFPTSITSDGDHRLFVIDDHGSGIVLFGRDGTFRGRQLTMGWKEGYLRYPADACVDPAGRLFVAERGNNRVQAFEIR